MRFSKILKIGTMSSCAEEADAFWECISALHASWTIEAQREDTRFFSAVDFIQDHLSNPFEICRVEGAGKRLKRRFDVDASANTKRFKSS